MKNLLLLAVIFVFTQVSASTNAWVESLSKNECLIIKKYLNKNESASLEGWLDKNQLRIIPNDSVYVEHTTIKTRRQVHVTKGWDKFIIFVTDQNELIISGYEEHFSPWYIPSYFNREKDIVVTYSINNILIKKNKYIETTRDRYGVFMVSTQKYNNYKLIYKKENIEYPEGWYSEKFYEDGFLAREIHYEFWKITEDIQY